MSEQRRLFKNSFAMLINRLVQGITTFALTAMIARTLGADELGQYLLAFSYYYIFMSISSQGLKIYFTRELARAPLEIPVYLLNGTVLQLILSAVAYLALVIVVSILPYSPDTKIVCCILGLTIFPFSLSNITEAIFQAQERMHLIAISTVPVYVLRLLIMIWALQHLYGIQHLAVILVLSETFILAVQWGLICQKLKLNWKIKQDFIWGALHSARTFVIIEAMGILASRIQLLTLSLLGSETLVGIYGGIEQLMQPFYITCNSILLSVFPKMSKERDQEKQRQLTENVLEILLCLALPLLLGILFFPKDLLISIYRHPAFQQGVLPLQLVALTLISYAFLRTLGNVLLATGYEKLNLIEVTIATLLGGVAGIFWIPQYELVGAAYMALLMSYTSAGLFTYFVYSRLFVLRLWKVMFRPLVISFIMVPIFILLRRLQVDFLIALAVSTSFYVLLIGLISIQALGGFRKVYSKVFSKSPF